MHRQTLFVVAAFLFAIPCSVATAEPIDDALAEKVSLTGERQSLQEALNALAKQVQEKHPKFAIKLLGKDLQAEGITRNQTVRNLPFKDATVAEILTALARQANPVADLKPTDPMQKLVWLTGPDPADSERVIILITTRAAAARRGDKLPGVFQKAP